MTADDLRTPEACVRALYDVISGPADEPRDWERFRALCLPDARFLLATQGPDGTPLTQSWSVEEFVAAGTSSFAARGLWEAEVGSERVQWGRLAHVFSAYATRLDAPDAPVVARGINSIQLVRDATGAWRIAQLAWDRERADQPLPPHLAPADG
jgi:hypothetical protein